MGGAERVGRRLTSEVRWDQSHLIPLLSHQAPKSYFANLFSKIFTTVATVILICWLVVACEIFFVEYFFCCVTFMEFYAYLEKKLQVSTNRMNNGHKHVRYEQLKEEMLRQLVQWRKVTGICRP